MDSIASCVKCRTVHWIIEGRLGEWLGCPMCRILRRAEWDKRWAKEVTCVPCEEGDHERCVRPCVCRAGRIITA